MFEDDLDKNIQFNNDLELCQPKMDKIFIENPYLKNTIQFKDRKMIEKEI